MTKDDVVAPAWCDSVWCDSVCCDHLWCDNVWCGEVYDAREGWGGRCPSCVALADEHLCGAHQVVIEACVECRREPRSAHAAQRTA